MGNKHSSTWESLKPQLMARMQSRLAEDFDDFAMTCEQTERLAHWALKLEPHHVPALICLATIYQVAGNTSKEAEMRQRTSTIIDRLSEMPESQLSSFELGILNSVH